MKGAAVILAIPAALYAFAAGNPGARPQSMAKKHNIRVEIPVRTLQSTAKAGSESLGMLRFHVDLQPDEKNALQLTFKVDGHQEVATLSNFWVGPKVVTLSDFKTCVYGDRAWKRWADLPGRHEEYFASNGFQSLHVFQIDGSSSKEKGQSVAIAFWLYDGFMLVCEFKGEVGTLGSDLNSVFSKFKEVLSGSRIVAVS